MTTEFTTKLDRKSPSAKITNAVYGVSFPIISGSAMRASGLGIDFCTKTKNCAMSTAHSTDKMIPVAAHRKSKYQRQYQHAKAIIPVEKLEPPLLAGEFLRIGPRAPTDHRDNAHQHRNRIGLNQHH